MSAHLFVELRRISRKQNDVHQSQENKKKVKSRSSFFWIIWINPRHCTNPIPAFGGKECLKNPDYKYLSHEKAEMDTADCVTEITINKHHGEELTPWCPENCIVTEWSSWSKCHPKCIESPVTKILENNHSPYYFECF